MASELLANGSFSLPETQSRTCLTSATTAEERCDRKTLQTIKESSPLISKECSLLTTKESSFTSHFSVGEKVGIFTMIMILPCQWSNYNFCVTRKILIFPEKNSAYEDICSIFR